mgnify:CR=1 FL=1
MSTTDYEQGVFGPGHGCVFNTDEDHYYFAYLEFGRRSTNRQTYVNRLEFNEDGTIRPVKLSLDGVGALRKVKGRKEIKADTVYASSTAAPMFIKPMKDGGMSVVRSILFRPLPQMGRTVPDGWLRKGIRTNGLSQIWEESGKYGAVKFILCVLRPDMLTNLKVRWTGLHGGSAEDMMTCG